MANNDMPILGCAPSYVRAGARITELAEAIERVSVESEHYYGHIEMWAREIISQVNVIKEMRYFGGVKYGEQSEEAEHL